MYRKLEFWVLLLCLWAGQAAYAISTDSLRQVIPTLQGEAKGKAIVDLYLAYYAKGEVDSTLMMLDELIRLRQEEGDIQKEGNARWSRVAILNNAARFQQLADETIIQMPWFSEHEIWDRYYQVWQRKCSAFHDLQKVQTSLREAQMMHDDALERGNLVGQGLAYKQMGVVYYDLHQYEQACKTFRESIRLLSVGRDSVGVQSGVYDFLCRSLHELKRYEEVLQTAEAWSKYLDVVGIKQGKRVVMGPRCSQYIVQAAALISLNRQEEAQKYLDKAEVCYRTIPTALSRYYMLLLRMKVFLAENKVDSVLTYADSVAMLGEAFDDGLDTLKAQALIRVGRADEAVRIYRDLYVRNDTLYSREMRMQLDELNTLFQVDELKLQSQVLRQKSFIVVIVIVLLALLLLIYFRFRSMVRLKKEHQLVEKANMHLKESNRQLGIAKAQAEESSRMKTNFIRQISHEIRTPLNILCGFTQVITTPGMEFDEKSKADISKRITENTERITSLVNKMLELSEANSQSVIERGDDVAASRLAELAVEESHIAKASHIVFTVAVDDDMKTVMLRTNQRYAARALSLLLDNAQKFTKEGAVCLRVVQEHPQHVSFVVEDTGIGVPPEEAEHIFDEFVQLDEYYDGTGIGLTVARSITRRMGGDVVLDTKYEGGARFVMTLPLS